MGQTKLNGANTRLRNAEYQRERHVLHILKYMTEVSQETRIRWQNELTAINYIIDKIQDEIFDLTPKKEIPIPSVGIWDGTHNPQ